MEFFNYAGDQGYTQDFADVRDSLNNYIVQNTYSFNRNLYCRGSGRGIDVHGHGRYGLGVSENDCADCLGCIGLYLLASV